MKRRMANSQKILNEERYVHLPENFKLGEALPNPEHFYEERYGQLPENLNE